MRWSPSKEGGGGRAHPLRSAGYLLCWLRLQLASALQHMQQVEVTPGRGRACFGVPYVVFGRKRSRSSQILYLGDKNNILSVIKDSFT